MTTAQMSRIAPPPSVEAVLGALTDETRIGQVDFTERLIPEPEVDETDELELDETGELELDETGDAGAVVTLKSVPDLEHAAPAPKPRARATRRTPEPEPEPEPVVEASTPKRATRAKGLGKTLAAKRRTTRSADTTDTTDAVDPAAENESRSDETVEEHSVPASLMDRVHTPATHTDLREDEPHGLVVPDLDERPPTVEEIARLVVERMHDAELAMMRHLEAVQAEAARRCELLTAQAELDAELIRLNARREAHGIITDARLRAEGRVSRSPEQGRLDELTESLTRFADVVDELRPAPTRSPAGRTP